MRTPTAYLVAALAAALAAGCSEGTPVGPTVGELEVAAVTTGQDLDPDGYVLVMRDRTRAIGVNQTLTLADLTPGDQEVELTEVAPNCAVAGSNPRTVRVSARSRASISFSVACQALGTLEVTTVTTGQDLDPDGYVLAHEAGWRAWAIGVNDTLRIRFYPGSHSVELTGVAPNCSVAGSTLRVVEVPSGATVSITYEVACQAVVRPVLPGRIVFYSDRDGDFEVYLMNADGSAQTRLTTHPAFDGVPALSPDGTRILFETTRDGNSEIYLINADGTEPGNLTNHPAHDERPSWSPDGTKILFVSNRDGPVDIFVMNADGSDPVNLTNNQAVDRPAAWSPDGTRIAFSSSRTGDFEIFVMDADGSNLVNLTNDPAMVDFAPAWSPDGSRIAFTSRRAEDPRTDVVVMNADGSGRVDLTKNPATDDRAPSWSPDGAWIAFTTNRTGRSEVFVMRAEGSEPFNVSNSPRSSDIAGWPQAWRP